MLRYAFVVVLFKPDDSVFRNIEKYKDVGVFVVNNGPGDYEGFLRNELAIENVFYQNNSNKGGIAGAFNVGLTEAFKQGYEFCFTFDQDSCIFDDFIPSMDNLIGLKHADLVCPNFFDVNSKTYATFVSLYKFKYKVDNYAECTAFPISSGMGISKKAWDEIGKFNENYFIDHVDTDFALRAATLGYRFFVNHGLCLNHAIGQRSLHKFLGVTLKPNHHNYVRKYYIVRNGTHLAFKYILKYPSYFYMNILRVIHEVLCVLLYEKDKMIKIKSMTKGLFHAVIGRLGAYE